MQMGNLRQQQQLSLVIVSTERASEAEATDAKLQSDEQLQEDVPP